MKVLKAKPVSVSVMFDPLITPIRKDRVVAQRAAHFPLHVLH